MKIALCFSGQLRTGPQCAENILRYLGDLKDSCDVFVHTWDVRSEPTAANYQFIPVEKQVFNDFYSAYNPIAMVVEPYNLRPLSNLWSGYRVDPATGRHIIGMFEGIYEANQLKALHEQKHNFTYDYVVRIRPDTVFHPSKRLADDLQLIVNNQMFVYGAHHGDFGMSRLEDIFWIGPSWVMDQLATFYEVRANSLFCGNVHSHTYVDWQFHMANWVRDGLGLQFRALDNNYMRIYYLSDIARGIDPMNPNFGNPPGKAGSWN